MKVMKTVRTLVAGASFHGPVWLAAATSWLHAAAAAGGRTAAAAHDRLCC